MLEHCLSLLHHFSIPFEVVNELTEAAKRFFAIGQRVIEEINDEYYGDAISLKEADEKILTLSSELPLPKPIFAFILRASLSKTMRELYKQNGYDDALFWETIADMQYKLQEHKKKHGTYGLEASNWYDLFFKLKLFKIGRFEYEAYRFPCETVTVGDFVVQKGDPVYYVHIPSCGPMTRELRLESYRLAYHFFGKSKNTPLVCYCASWLVSPKFREVLPPHLNMVDFVDDWKIFKVDTDNGANLWRVFDKNYTGDPSLLPRDNTLRRALGEWLDRGGMTEFGYGLMVFDGEKVITYTGTQTLFEQYIYLLKQLCLPKNITEVLGCVATRFFEVANKDLPQWEVAYNNQKIDIAQIAKQAEHYATTLSVSPLTINYILCTSLSKTLWEKYANIGQPPEFFEKKIKELQQKVLTCQKESNVYGIYLSAWQDFFKE